MESVTVEIGGESCKLRYLIADHTGSDPGTPRGLLIPSVVQLAHGDV